MLAVSRRERQLEEEWHMAAQLRALEAARSQLQAQVTAQEEAISVLEQVKVRQCGRAVRVVRRDRGCSCPVTGN